MTEGDGGNIYTDIATWAGNARNTLAELVAIFDDWYRRRRLLTRALLGAMAGVLPSVAVTMSDIILLGTIFPLGTNQLLIALLGVAASQTVIQTRTLNRIRDAVTGNMETTDVRTDGGNHTTEEVDTYRSGGSGVTGGGAIGGAIVGAGIGSSLGAGGTVMGAVLGAVLGDWFEERALV